MGWDYISVTWTPGVEEADARLLLKTVQHIYKLLRRHFGPPGQFDPLPAVQVFGAWALEGTPDHTAYRSINDYIFHAMDDDSRLIASRYLEAVCHEPWQTSHPHFDFTLTDLPLLNNVNGEHPTLSDGFYAANRVALISLYPIASLNKPHLRTILARRTICHFFGRLFAVLQREGGVVVQDGLHTCANVCAMRTTRTPAHTLDYALQEHTEGILYCPTCQRELVARLTSAHYGRN
jgi:hypothetical protein